MTFKSSTSLAAICVATVIFCLVIIFFILRQHGLADIAGQQPRASLNVSSSSFINGDRMPSRITCSGKEMSPALEISPPPTGTRSLAIVMDDTDSPFGFVHWVVYNIPSDVRALGEGASSHGELPTGATEGVNSADTVGYVGPCHKGHHYVVRVYALDMATRLSPGTTKRQLASTVKGHVLAEGQLTGIDAGN
jgi:Raf kinase inhibitor-like YbhB/YbcL family protein